MGIRLTPDYKSNCVIVHLEWMSSPGDVFPFVSLEGILSENTDFGLFSVNLQESDWKITENSLAYEWTYEPGLLVRTYIEAQGEELKLKYSIENQTNFTFKKVQLHPCIPTNEAPSFHPEADTYPSDVEKPCWFSRVRNKTVQVEDSYFELYKRLLLWNSGKSFYFTKSDLSNQEVHLAYCSTNLNSPDWAWWINAKERFDIPLITLSSHNRDKTLVHWFEDARWASANVGEVKACFHLFPFFGDLAPGQEKTICGGLFLSDMSPEDIYSSYDSFAK